MLSSETPIRTATNFAASFVPSRFAGGRLAETSHSEAHRLMRRPQSRGITTSGRLRRFRKYRRRTLAEKSPPPWEARDLDCAGMALGPRGEVTVALTHELSENRPRVEEKSSF